MYDELLAVLVCILGYLLGSIPFGLLLTQTAGLGDIRLVPKMAWYFGHASLNYGVGFMTPLYVPSGDENAGGGQIRAVIAAGEQIRTCNVAPAYLPMFRANSSRPVGRVKMLYGRVRNGDALAYGWFAVAWQLDGGAWSYFVD